MSDNNTTSSNNNTTFGVIPAAGFVIKSAMDFKAPFSVFITSVSATRAIEVSSDGVGYDITSVLSETTSTLTAGIDYRWGTIRVTGAPGDKWGTL